MSEAALMRRIQIKASKLGSRLFRNNCGSYHIGNRWIKYGVANPGGSDLIGYKPIIITTDMVGQRVAVFYAVEVKAGSPTTRDQAAFLKAVIKAGGIGVLAKSEGDITL